MWIVLNNVEVVLSFDRKLVVVKVPDVGLISSLRREKAPIDLSVLWVLTLYLQQWRTLILKVIMELLMRELIPL